MLLLCHCCGARVGEVVNCEAIADGSAVDVALCSSCMSSPDATWRRRWQIREPEKLDIAAYRIERV